MTRLLNSYFHRVEFFYAILLCCLLLPILLVRLASVPADGMLYLQPAMNLLLGRGYSGFGESWLETAKTLRPVLYSGFLAVGFSLFGTTLQSAFIVAKFFSVVLIIETYLLARLLWNRNVALLSAALMVSSSYILVFQTTLFVDIARVTCEMASIILLLLAYRFSSRKLLLTAGVFLGIAFLVKELAILQLIWIIPAHFLTPAFYNKFRFRSVALYFWGGFALTAAQWWIYVYLITGQIYLASSWVGSTITLFARIMGVLILVATAVTFIIFSLTWRRKYYRRLISWKIRLAALIERHQQVLAVAAYLTILLLFVRVFGIYGKPLQSLVDVPWRIYLFAAEYFPSQVVARQPLLILVPIAGLFITGRALLPWGSRERILLLIALSNLPVVLLVAVPDQFVWNIRQLFSLYPLFYIAIAFTLWHLITMLSSAIAGIWNGRETGGHARLSASRLGSAATVGIMLVCLVASSNSALEQGKLARHRAPNDWNNENVLELSEWISSNIPKQSTVLVTTQFGAAIDFFTQGQFDMRLLKLSNTSIGEEQAISFLELVQQLGGTDLIYLSRDNRGVYTTLLESRLQAQLQQQKVQYLVVSQGNYSYNLRRTLEYFDHHPAFEPLYSKSWDNVAKVSVYKVNRELLQPSSHALEVTGEVVQLFQDRLLSDTIPPGELQTQFAVVPELAPTILLYEKIANAFAQLSPDAAAFALQRLLNAQPGKADALLAEAEALVAAHPEHASPWALLGMLRLHLNTPELAEQAFVQSRLAQATSIEAQAASFTGSGLYHLFLGSYAQAEVNFERAGEIDVWQRKSNLALSRLSRALAKDNIQSPQANQYYREALELSETAVLAAVENAAQYALSNGNKSQAVNYFVNLFRNAGMIPMVRESTLSFISLVGISNFSGEFIQQVVDSYRYDTLARPNNIDSYFSLAMAYRSLGKTEDALAVYNEMIDLWPKEMSVYGAMSEAYKDSFLLPDEHFTAQFTDQLLAQLPASEEYVEELRTVYFRADKISQWAAVLPKIAKKTKSQSQEYVELGKALIAEDMR